MRSPASCSAVLGGDQVVHGHSVIADQLGVAPAQIEAPYEYADGRALGVDGGVFVGGPCLVVRLPFGVKPDDEELDDTVESTRPRTPPPRPAEPDADPRSTRRRRPMTTPNDDPDDDPGTEPDGDAERREDSPAPRIVSARVSANPIRNRISASIHTANALLTPNAEAAMADGWRNRYMAPFYALAISFVLVLLLGFTLSSRPERGPEAAGPDDGHGEPEPEESSVRFSSKETPFPVTVAIVVVGRRKEDREEASPTWRSCDPPSRSGSARLMARGWVAVKAEKLEDTDYVCWGPLEPKRPGDAITINVGKDG